MYQIRETKQLLEDIIEEKTLEKLDAKALVESFFEFLEYAVFCDEDDYLVEAMPFQEVNSYTEEVYEEKMCLLLTRQMIYNGQNSFWQTTLNIRFKMTPYFEKYRLKPNLFSLIKTLLNKNKNSIWGKKDSNNRIAKLIKDVLANGVFDSYSVILQDAE